MKYSDAIAQIKQYLKKGEARQALDFALAVRRAAPQDIVIHDLIKTCTNALHKQEMGSRGDFVKNSLKVIKSLRKAGEVDKAVQASRELLDVAPDDKRVQKIHHKTAIAFIEAKLHDPLKKQLESAGEHEKLYQFYQKLRQVFPECKKINTLMKRTEKKLIELDRERKKEFAEASLVKLREWFKDAKYEQVIQGAKELQAVTHQGSREAAILLKKAVQANEREINVKVVEFMRAEQSVLRVAYESGSEPMIRL